MAYMEYGTHTTESCPLNNTQSRETVLKAVTDRGLNDIALKNKKDSRAVSFNIET